MKVLKNLMDITGFPLAFFFKLQDTSGILKAYGGDNILLITSSRTRLTLSTKIMLFL